MLAVSGNGIQDLVTVEPIKFYTRMRPLRAENGLCHSPMYSWCPAQGLEKSK